VGHVNHEIKDATSQRQFEGQRELDAALIQLDGTANFHPGPGADPAAAFAYAAAETAAEACAVPVRTARHGQARV